MNAITIVKEYFPTANDEMARDVLWCCTGWPHFFRLDNGQTLEDGLRAQLYEISSKSNGCPFTACCISDHEMELAFERGRQEHAERIRVAAYFRWQEATGGAPVSEDEARQFWAQAEEVTV